LKQLFALSLVRLTEMGKAPVFSGPRAEEKREKYFEGFCNSFSALGFISRADALDRKHSFGFWLDRAKDLISQRGISRDLDGFLQAAIAWGDIPYNDPREFPYVQEFGLRDYNMGKPATDGWKKILAGGRAPEPTTVKAPFVRAG
jgi:hypothetical protein